MFSNYLTIIFRNLRKNKIYTLINIVGLSAGLVVFLLIFSYVYYEFSFDQYHKNKDRIYRVAQEQFENYYLGNNRFAVTSPPLAPVLMEEYEDVELATRISKGHNILVGNGKESFVEPRIFGIDPESFGIFTFEYLLGNPEVYLKEKYTVVITESIANKYFDNQNPIGQTLLYRNKNEFTVVGVVKDMPKNSHFVMDIMFHYESILEANNRSTENWRDGSSYTYILLNKNANPKSLEAKFPSMLDKYTDDKLDENGQSTRLFLQKFDRIHMYSTINFDIKPSSKANNFYTYSIIAVLILLIACVNYINLASALATKRAREIGIRKISGAHRYQLILQFLGESFAMTFFALLISLGVIMLIMPSFEQFVGRDLSFNVQEDPQLLLILFLTCLFVGLISGSYPALRLSSFIPIEVLKGSYQSSKKGSGFRNILVITQFTISSVLVISTIIIAGQLSYIQNRNMGYNRDLVVTMNIRDNELINKITVFKDKLRNVPGVIQVSSSSSLPNDVNWLALANWPGKPKEEEMTIYMSMVDYDFVELYDMEILEGRNFSRELDKPGRSFIINEAAAKVFGWDNPLEHELIDSDTGKIVGVIKNFHQHSLRQEIKPLQILLEDEMNKVSIKISGDDIQNTIAEIKKTKESFSNIFPFEYTFFDEIFDNAYKSEQKIASLAKWFSGLTILIACLGMYGLASFTTEKRIKEVGIRKVLGASVAKIIYLLSRDFTRPVIISFIISTPIAYYFMQQWLNNFAYHINIGFLTFLGTLVIMILVSWITVGYRTFSIANSNPVEAIKNE